MVLLRFLQGLKRARTGGPCLHPGRRLRPRVEVLEDRTLLAATNLVVNGGFEQPPVPFGTVGFFQSIPGWSLSSGPDIEVQNHVAGAGVPAEGDQFVELDSHASSAI